MTDLNTGADTAQPAESTIYFVVPLKPTAMADASKPLENLVPCAYFDTTWQRVKANDLVTNAGSDSITFLQQGELPASALAALQPDGVEPDKDVSLFAAVAKTLEIDCNMPRTFEATGRKGGGYIKVPVEVRTIRGVVLVFRKPAEGGAQKLIATADPEIRNGSGT